MRQCRRVACCHRARGVKRVAGRESQPEPRFIVAEVASQPFDAAYLGIARQVVVGAVAQAGERLAAVLVGGQPEAQQSFGLVAVAQHIAHIVAPIHRVGIFVILRPVDGLVCVALIKRHVQAGFERVLAVFKPLPQGAWFGGGRCAGGEEMEEVARVEMPARHKHQFTQRAQSAFPFAVGDERVGLRLGYEREKQELRARGGVYVERGAVQFLKQCDLLFRFCLFAVAVQVVVDEVRPCEAVAVRDVLSKNTAARA